MAGSRPPTPGRELYFVSGAGVYLRPMGGEPAFNIWFQELGGNSRIHVNNEDAIAEGPTKTQIMFAIRPFADAALMDNDFVRTRSDWLADQLSGLLAVCDNRGVYRFLSRDRSQSLLAAHNQSNTGQGGSATSNGSNGRR